MTELRQYFGWLRWNLKQNEVDLIQESWVRDRAVWFSSLVLVGAILGAGLMVGLLWLNQRDQQGWQQEQVSESKRGRSQQVGTRLVLQNEEWIR